MTDLLSSATPLTQERRLITEIPGPRSRELMARRTAAVSSGVGTTMLPRLRALQERTPAIGDLRGRGAMIALEIVRPGTTEPDPALTAQVARLCHAEGVVVLTAGSFGNVLCFLPPLVIGHDLLTEALDVLEAAFASATTAVQPVG